MELPKNVTQIGESDRTCKVYVEDYVVSYLKQLNQVARNKDIAVALYGIRKEEGEVSYLFLYGAAKLNFLQREVRHLSQAQLQEIEQNRQRFFSEYEFQGYRILNGEMIEGFHICERGICRYIAGYAQFYEKNDSMLNFMLEARSGEVQPEFVDQEKYETVKRRQEARKAHVEEGKAASRKAETIRETDTSREEKTPGEGLSSAERSDLSKTWKKEEPNRTSLRKMKVAAVAMFLLLCLVGLTSMNGGLSLEDIQVMARQTLDGLTEQRLPNEEDQGAIPAMGTSANSDTLITEDKLTEAVRKENEQTGQAVQETTPSEETSQVVKETQENEEKPPEIIPETSAGRPTEPAREESSATEAAGQAMVSYVIERGDTLTNICVRNYGSDARVQEICRINSISDPDDIKVGQKILLPQ